MAITTNCIEYGWETSLATTPSGSTYTTPYKPITIPETASRIFEDVSILHHVRNVGNEASTNLGYIQLSVQIDSNPTASVSCLAIVSSAAEQISLTTLFGVTEYFNAYFTASTHNVRFYTNSNDGTGGINRIGESLKLICTYKFNDALVNAGIKTVRFPINSSTSIIGTSLQYLGNYTASIPALDSYLPELNKDFKDIFVEYHGNDAGNAVTNFSLRTMIDTDASQSRFVISQSLNSAAYYYDIHNLSGSISTATTHSIRVASSLANRFTGLGGILYATYTYDYTASKAIMSSVIYPMGDVSVSKRSTDDDFAETLIYIPTTGSVWMARSGILTGQNGTGAANVLLSTDAGSLTTYTLTAGSIQTGYIPIVHQIDGTGSSNPAISLSNGYNTIRFVSKFSAPNTSAVQLGGILLLNYITSASKPCETMHSINNTMISSSANLNAATFGFYYDYSATSSILEPNYMIDALVNVYHMKSSTNANAPIYAIFEHGCYATGSDNVANVTNPYPIGTIGLPTDSRYSFSTYYNDMTPVVMKYPEYIAKNGRNMIDLRSPHRFQFRQISLTSAAISQFGHAQWITYHSKLFPVTGSIANYSGTGADISITVYDYGTGEKLFVTQSLSGGNISTNWYSAHDNLMLVAETGSQRYVSNVLPAGSGSYLITIPTASTGAPGVPVEHSFTFIG